MKNKIQLNKKEIAIMSARTIKRYCNEYLTTHKEKCDGCAFHGAEKGCSLVCQGVLPSKWDIAEPSI